MAKWIYCSCSQLTSRVALMSASSICSEGFANAIADPRVVWAMTAGPLGRIALCFFEWSNEDQQIVVVDWTRIRGGK